MSRHFRAALAGSLLVLNLSLVGGFCPRRALAQDKGQVLKIEGDLRTMQGQWISKDEQGESVWNFKEEHVSLKTPTRAYEMTIKLNPKGEPEKHIDFDVSENSPNAKGYKARGFTSSLTTAH